MNAQQKGTILTLLKVDETTRSFAANYWFTYEDFLDPTDDFTDFSCERLEGKQEYIALIEHLRRVDKTARIFVQVYGFEEQCITADTFILFSKLPLSEIKQIFNQPGIFPSGIGEETNFSQPTFLIGEHGQLIPATKLLTGNYFAYYCWWD